MNDFRVELFDIINNAEYCFYKLYIDDVCHFDEFVETIKDLPREPKSLKGIYAYMDMFSSQIKLPKTKFRHIEGTDRDDVFEFKKDNVRVYIILQKPNIYIITGGLKKTQDTDVKRLKKQVKDFSI
jgi:hypothetical protein